VAAFALLGSTIFAPKFHLGNIALGVDDILSPFLLLYLFLSPIFFGKIHVPSNRLLLLWLALILHGIVFGIFGGMLYLDKLTFPSEMWQYIRRMSFFYIGFSFARENKISAVSTLFTLIGIVTLAGFIGILQVVPGNSLGDALASLYCSTDWQYTQLAQRGYASRRVFGVAGNSISWGGFCAFGLALSLYPLIRSSRSFLAELNFLKTSLIGSCALVCLLNVLFSASRAAVLSVISLGIFLFYMGLRSWQEHSTRLWNCILFFFFSALVVGYFFIDRIDFILFRYEALLGGLQRGTGRVEQIQLALELLREHPLSLVLGTGNAVQRSLVKSFGIEVEPVYLLVNYGVTGFFLRYGLLLLLFKYATSLWRRSSDPFSQSLAGSTLCAIVVYLTFSMGFFFFQELHVGTFPWLLFGWTAGEHHRILSLAGSSTCTKNILQIRSHGKNPLMNTR
jgi:hypothetical protein